MDKIMKNMMSVDLEDFYCDLPFSKWKNYEGRAVHNTQKILDLFEKYNVKATFFTLGFIAEKYPELIEEIQSKGHEIASHGYQHLDARNISKNDFENDLKKSLNILESITKEKIKGFRAPFFSVNKKNVWVLDILKKYLKYDSSIFPAKTPMYGISDAITHPYKISDDSPLTENKNGDFYEIPPLILKLPLRNIPVAGGFFLRFLPIQLIKFSIKKMNEKGFPAMCYIHPKDLDPEMPKIPQYAWHYYWGLNNSTQKFENLLKNFEFNSVRENLKI
jgi:polysaccharide deacetylase family protein (PEP-CTERM system associated)|tara:strand:+ start:4505 stop:5332 length:828 start_codon:yes stop_codon:yes gene_type:complete